MRKMLLFGSAALLLLSATASRGDEASKAKLLEEWLQQQGKNATGMIWDKAITLTEQNPRLRPESRQTVARKLVEKTDKAQTEKKLREVLDQYFTEAGLNYLVALLKSDISKKVLAMDAAVDGETKPFLNGLMTPIFEQELKQMEGELLPPGGPKAFEPNWATKMLWKVFPDQKPSCLP